RGRPPRPRNPRHPLPALRRHPALDPRSRRQHRRALRTPPPLAPKAPKFPERTPHVAPASPAATRPPPGPPTPQTRVPSRPEMYLGSDLRPAEDRLGLEELLEAGGAPLAPVARLLVAAERGADVERGTVHVHVAGTDAAGDAAGALQVAARDVAR